MLLKSIRDVLPEIDRNDAQDIAKSMAAGLKERHVYKREHLKHVKVPHLEPYVAEIQACRLIESWTAPQEQQASGKSQKIRL